jgi:hypothetical protein
MTFELNEKLINMILSDHDINLLAVTRLVIFEDYKYLNLDIEKLLEKETLSALEKQELEDMIGYSQSFEHILQYYLGKNWSNQSKI